jgi:predicted nucleic acid-binding protein
LNWFLDRLERFPVHLATLPRQHDVLELAQKHRLTFYDATYLELAKRENLSLATLDRNLAQAASAEGVPLLGVPQ